MAMAPHNGLWFHLERRLPGFVSALGVSVCVEEKLESLLISEASGEVERGLTESDGWDGLGEVGWGAMGYDEVG